jgi:hypothetical protein
MTAQGESRNESNEAPRLIRNAAGGFSTVWPDGAEYEVCTKDSPLELAITAFVSESVAIHPVTQEMYEAGLKYLHGRGTAWCCTDLYLAMEDERVRSYRQGKAT